MTLTGQLSLRAHLAMENHLLLDSVPENYLQVKAKCKVVIKNTLTQVMLTFLTRQPYHNKHFNYVIFIQMINPCLALGIH